MTTKLGFIGIGRMGLPMSLRLMDRGYDLTIYDIRREAVEPLIARGARPGESPADVASRVETVLVSLPNPDAVREVALGQNGLIMGKALKVYVDLSTTGPKAAQEVASRLEERGVITIDAPVSGGVPGAERGSLTIMAAGPADVYQQVRPALEILGKNFYYIGEKVGQAQMMKLINNFLSATSMAASSEAFVLGVKAGLDPEVMVKVINSSTGRNSATQDKFPGYILQRNFEYGFKTELMSKDVRLCMEQAENLGVPMWVGNAVRQLWSYAVSQGGGPRDFTTIIQYLEAWAGVEVGKRVQEK